MTPEATERAAQLLLDGDLTGALEAFDAALGEAPEDPTALLGAARASLAMQRDERARAFLLRLLMVRPNHPEALSQLAAIRYRKDQDANALDELRALAAREDAGFAELYNLGVALLHADAIDEAESALLSARQRAPDSPHVLAQLGKLAFLRGDHPRALRDLGRAVELAPREWYPLRVLARVHLSLGELEQARACLDEALQRFPEGAALLLDRAKVLVALGRPADALEDARRLDANAPGNAEIAHLRGVTALAAGRLDEAREALERAVRDAPGAVESRLALARVIGAAGDQVRERSLLEEAVALAPSEAGPALDLSSLLLRTGEAPLLARAAEVAARGLEHHPEEPGLHLNLAISLRFADPPRALVHAGKAAEKGRGATLEQARRLLDFLGSRGS